MATANVNREVEDQFYRYKMPKLIAKVEGKGNGIKTVIVNMPEVAKALDRPPAYPCKYFGCELGAQVQFDKNDRFIVNGQHDANKLQDLLDGFIRKFVLCQNCDNPETMLVVQAKKGMILQRCAACGHQGDIDMRHKFTTFILKNPPVQNSSATPSKKAGKGKKKKDSNSADSPEAGQGDSNGQITPPANDAGFAEDDWCEDVSAEAVAQRLVEISGAARSMTVNCDLEKTEAERIDIFYKFVKDRKNDITTEVEKEIVGESERLDVKEKAPVFLAEMLYDENMLTQIKKYRTLFLRFTLDNGKAQKYLIGAFEQVVDKHKEKLMPKVPHILKQFYDTDLLEEEVILDWAKKVSKKRVPHEVAVEIHNKAKPFINWLSSAEEESSEEDEEEEEELQVDFSRTEKVGTQVIKEEKLAVASVPTPATAQEDEDDVDIDDI